jgi:hypothetical protein
MRARQRGVTFLGWVVLLVPVAIVFYSGIRLAPIYLNYMKVVRCLEQTAAGAKADDSLTRQSLRISLEKQFEINSLDFPSLNDITIDRADGRWTMDAAYEDVAPLFLNLAIVVKFDKSVQIGS